MILMPNWELSNYEMKSLANIQQNPKKNFPVSREVFLKEKQSNVIKIVLFYYLFNLAYL